MRRRVAGALPGLRRDVDKALWRLVAGRARPPEAAAAPATLRPLGGHCDAALGGAYAAIVRAYMHLDDLRVQVRHPRPGWKSLSFSSQGPLKGKGVAFIFLTNHPMRRAQAPAGQGGLPGAAGGHFDEDEEEEEGDEDSQSSCSDGSEDGSGDSDATEDMSFR